MNMDKAISAGADTALTKFVPDELAACVVKGLRKVSPTASGDVSPLPGQRHKHRRPVAGAPDSAVRSSSSRVRYRLTSRTTGCGPSVALPGISSNRYFFSSSFAWAAASRATGTRGAEQET